MPHNLTLTPEQYMRHVAVLELANDVLRRENTRLARELYPCGLDSKPAVPREVLAFLNRLASWDHSKIADAASTIRESATYLLTMVRL